MNVHAYVSSAFTFSLNSRYPCGATSLQKLNVFKNYSRELYPLAHFHLHVDNVNKSKYFGEKNVVIIEKVIYFSAII